MVDSSFVEFEQVATPRVVMKIHSGSVKKAHCRRARATALARAASATELSVKQADMWDQGLNSVHAEADPVHSKQADLWYSSSFLWWGRPEEEEAMLG